MTDLNKLFEPCSVALIGASNNPFKWGNWVAKCMLDSNYEGKVYFISKGKDGQVLGQPTYASVLDITAALDMAVISIPAPYVLSTVEECALKKVKLVVIVTAGYSETGDQGKKNEKQLLDLAQKHDMRIIGPNCMGIFNADIDLNASIFKFPKGNLGFLAQSGNFSTDVNFNLKRRRMGYSKWAAIGNQADLRFHDYLQYLENDPETRVIMLYMEGLHIDSAQDGRRFLAAARKASLKKPIVAIKIGASSAGVRAAASHTGSLAGTDAIFDAAFKQSGVIRVNRSADFINVAEALSKCVLPQGNRIGILTDGGGHGALTADAAEHFGLEVPLFSEKTQARLRELLPVQASALNPVDLAGAGESDLWNFEKCSRIILEDENIDSLLIVGQFGGYWDISPEFIDLELQVARALTELPREYGKPVIVHTMYQPSETKCLQVLSDNGIPVYPYVENALKSMGALHQYREYKNQSLKGRTAHSCHLPDDRRTHAQAIIRKARAQGYTNLPETDARLILQNYGFPMTEFHLVSSGDQAETISEAIGWPVAMKIVSPDIVHKSDAGGVIFNVNGKEAASAAFDRIMNNARQYNASARISGVLIAPMAQEGLECIIGMSTDRTFGPTVMFGLGGIFVETLQDVAFRVAPIDRETARAMIREIKGYTILTGVRGQKGADIDTLALIIERLSILAAENPEVTEIDLNPVRVHEKGITLLDARMIL